MITSNTWRTIQHWTLPVVALACFAAAQERPLAPPKKVGAGITSPRAIFTPDPIYAGRQGKKALPDRSLWRSKSLPDGTTNNIRVVKSFDPGFDQSAVEAVAHWRFRPATEAGMPVLAKIDVNINVPFPVGIFLPGPGTYSGLPCAAKIDTRNIKETLKKAKKGDPKAQLIIGCVCEYGITSFAPNLAQAIDWYRKAAESMVLAQYFLGETYLLNFDYVQAYTWLRIADLGGYQDPKDKLKTVALLLSKGQLSEAEDQVAASKRQHGTK
jgi:TonB family protein